MIELINKEHEQWKANVRVVCLNQMVLWRAIEKILKKKEPIREINHWWNQSSEKRKTKNKNIIKQALEIRNNCRCQN